MVLTHAEKGDDNFKSGSRSAALKSLNAPTPPIQIYVKFNPLCFSTAI